MWVCSPAWNSAQNSFPFRNIANFELVSGLDNSLFESEGIVGNARACGRKDFWPCACDVDLAATTDGAIASCGEIYCS